jgi:hypothetical protein
MSLLNFPFDVTNSPVKTDGTTSGYTAPAGRKGLITINMVISVWTNNGGGSNPYQFTSSNFTFMDTFIAGDAFTFTQSGEGSGASGTYSCSYLKNGVTQKTKSVSKSAGSGLTHFYTAKISYSVLELPA